MKRAAKRPVLIAVTSDQHCNSTVGLCPVPGPRLDDGGIYTPSFPQQWLWDNWLRFWGSVQELRRKHNARLVCVFNGDLVDGDHHGTTQIISRNLEVQAWVADEVFHVPMKLRPEEVWVVRGTEVHTGPSGSHEEALARRLNANRTADAWSHWALALEYHGLLVSFTHHGRIGTTPWTRTNPVNANAVRIWTEHLAAGWKPPTLCFRSDRHVVADSFEHCPVRVIQTPAWQLKTAFAHKVAPESIADVGGVIALVWPDGTYDIRKELYRPEQPKPANVAAPAKRELKLVA